MLVKTARARVEFETVTNIYYEAYWGRHKTKFSPFKHSVAVCEDVPRPTQRVGCSSSKIEIAAGERRPPPATTTSAAIACRHHGADTSPVHARGLAPSPQIACADYSRKNNVSGQSNPRGRGERLADG